MSDNFQFKNRKPKNINLIKWFFGGFIIGIIFGTASGLYTNQWIIDPPIVTVLGFGVILGFLSIKFRKWLLSTFWI